MNPPFHEISGEVSLELGLSFFRVAHSLLCPGGKLFWVANAHLPYLSEVKKKFRKVSVLGSDSHFLVGYAQR
jgi:16S rRNA (guanine1207-N2)-methyltransferase